MGMKKVYTCDVCRDKKEKYEVKGCNFKNLVRFRLDSPDSTEGIHICGYCLAQIFNQCRKQCPMCGTRDGNHSAECPFTQIMEEAK